MISIQASRNNDLHFIWRVIVSGSFSNKPIDVGHYSSEKIAQEVSAFVKTVFIPELPNGTRVRLSKAAFLRGLDNCALDYNVRGEKDLEGALKRTYGIENLDAAEYTRLLADELENLKNLASQKGYRKTEVLLRSYYCIKMQSQPDDNEQPIGYYQAEKVANTAIRILQNMHPLYKFAVQSREEEVFIRPSGNWQHLAVISNRLPIDLARRSPYIIHSQLMPNEIRRFTQLDTLMSPPESENESHLI